MIYFLSILSIVMSLGFCAWWIFFRMVPVTPDNKALFGRFTDSVDLNNLVDGNASLLLLDDVIKLKSKDGDIVIYEITKKSIKWNKQNFFTEIYFRAEKDIKFTSKIKNGRAVMPGTRHIIGRASKCPFSPWNIDIEMSFGFEPHYNGYRILE